jgi:DNA modification methylase
LVEACLRNSSLARSVVLDPFLGSGTTLVAAERLGRRCYGLELNPQYIAVAVRRWEDFTGRKAEQI